MWCASLKDLNAVHNDLLDAMSQNDLKLPKLTRNKEEVSTNPSSMRKEKRSLSTLNGGKNNLRATLDSQDQASNFGLLHRDSSLSTLNPAYGDN